MSLRVLVSDAIAQEGLALLEDAAEVDVKVGLGSEELVKALSDYDALVVRSQTKVTREALESARRLRVVGRAGVGVDNIDVAAATERGVVVVNAPTGNTISAAELTLALILALARNVLAADASLRRGEWNRSAFVGIELRGKTVGLVGLGQVGSAVARRLRAMETTILVYDPFVPPERTQMLGAELVGLESLLERSDFVSLHCALTPETAGLIGRENLARMKKGARVINTARGGLIDEPVLIEALDREHLAGAALDVFQEEPAIGNALLRHPKVLVTPHLGASTVEAQERVAVDVAREVLRVLKGEPATTAVNAPFLDPETLEVVGPYLPVAEICGRVATQLAEESWREIAIDYRGELAQHNVTPLKAAVVAGLLSTISEENVNVVSLQHVLNRRGWRVSERKLDDGGPYTNLLSVRLSCLGGEVRVSGTLVHGTPHLVDINGFEVDVTRGTLAKGQGCILIVENEDRPGRVGAVGTALGEMEINIAHMAVGRRDPGDAIMVLSINRLLDAKEIRQIGGIPGIEKVVQVTL